VRLVLVPFVPPDLFAGLRLVETAHRKPGAVTTLAPAVLRVEREQARVEIGKAARTGGTCAARAEDVGSGLWALGPGQRRRALFLHRPPSAVRRPAYVHDAFAVCQRRLEHR